MYQWLPSEFTIDRANDKTDIKSYINNLDQYKYSELYNIIPKIFNQFICMFDHLLDQKLPDNIQVIVKAANIILTPENPTYQGGSWHIEGMPYEHIIATGIYYYDIENITPSYLEFRRALSGEVDYPQNAYTYVSRHYGLEDESPLNEYMGKVLAQQGKCIVFPNTMQHRVAPFTLLDQTRPAHRKILVFFLIDPNNRILSTQDVPMQQEYMARQYVIPILQTRLNHNIIEKIISHMELMTKDQSHHYRARLMYFRKYFINKINEEVFEREFSLCEH